jgi:NADPH:quinone reductase-like Zn-dependent oxidoreductase
MKAAVRSKYGPPDVLSVREIPKPTPKANEVLVRVFAATVNRSDCHVLTGKPRGMRLFTGLFAPKLASTGTDFAGRIEAVGSDVRSFKVRDDVMGFGGVFGIGSHAEYIAFPEGKGIVLKPQNVTYHQAVACLEGGFYASTGITQIEPSAGQRALVYGATGAIGSAHVQLLKSAGLYVTAVCAGKHRDLVKALGADKVVDYETEDFTKTDDPYDFVFDAVGKTSFPACRGLLKPTGMFSSSGGFDNLFWAIVTRVVGGKRVLFMAPKDVKGNLGIIKTLLEQGRFKPVIDREYPLERIVEAFTYVQTGQKIGNVVLTIE